MVGAVGGSTAADGTAACEDGGTGASTEGGVTAWGSGADGLGRSLGSERGRTGSDVRACGTLWGVAGTTGAGTLCGAAAAAGASTTCTSMEGGSWAAAGACSASRATPIKTSIVM